MRARGTRWLLTALGSSALIGLLAFVLLGTDEPASLETPKTGVSPRAVPSDRAFPVRNATNAPAIRKPEAGRAAVPVMAPRNAPTPEAYSAPASWVLHGHCVQVQDGNDHPVPQARVMIESGGLSIRVEADAIGRFVADLAPLRNVPLRDGRCEAKCRAEAPGFGMREAFLITDVPVDLEQSYKGTARLELEPCATITGRVVDSLGRPVVGAKLEGSEIVGTENTEDGMGWCLEKETFSIPCFLHGEIGLRALATGAGISPWIKVTLRPPGTVRVPDLVLRPLGEISGRVRFPDGSPAPHIPLCFESVEILYYGSHFEGYQGEPCATVHADDQGRFSVRSLQPGLYDIAPCDERTVSDPRPRATTAHTGDMDVDVCLDRPVLLVTPPGALRGKTALSWWSLRLASWNPPQADQAMACYAAGLDPLVLPHRVNGLYMEDEDPVFRFVEPGSFHYLAVSLQGYESELHAIRFAPDDWLHEVKLTLRPLDSPAELLVTLFDTGGVELIEREVVLEPLGGPPLLRETVTGQARPNTPLRVKPGRYRLQVRFPLPGYGDNIPASWSTLTTAFLPLKQEIALPPGSTRLVLHTERVGFLRASTDVKKSVDPCDVMLTVRRGKHETRHELVRPFAFYCFGTTVPLLTEWLPLSAGQYELLLQKPGLPPERKVVKLKTGNVRIVTF